MQQKHINLINILIKHESLTAQKLANFLHVSTRSINNYIHEINTIESNLITSSNKGYKINIQKAKQILQQSTQFIPQTSTERQKFLLNYIVKHENTINLYDICELLFISLSTLKNDLNKIKNTLSTHDLELRTKGDFIQCIGLEKNKRKLLSTILYDESNVNFINIDSIQKTFNEIDVILIKNLINEIIINQYHYFINDYSLINLILHIAISIDRIKNGNINKDNISYDKIKQLSEYNMILEFSSTIEQKFNIKYSPAELYEMALLLISRTTTIDYKTVNKHNLEQFVGSKCLILVQKIINDIADTYYIDISESEFFIRFSLHIRNLFLRAKNNNFSKNPLTNNIKMNCPLIYDMAVNIANIIHDNINILINEDEIAYIALHLGSTLKAQKNLDQKIKSILFCPNYYDLHTNIYNYINKYFQDDLLITNIITDESDLYNIRTTDLLITTVPIKNIINTPTILINIFFNNTDKKLLSKTINTIQNNKKQVKFKNYLTKLILPDFFKKVTSTNQEECIKIMVNKLIEFKYVDNNFYTEVLQREAASSTAFNNFAIPHTLKMNAYKTGINILISEKAINWNNNQVHLVMMLCFNRNDRKIFYEIYDTITLILNDPCNFKKIIACNNYEEFINTLSSLV